MTWTSLLSQLRLFSSSRKQIPAVLLVLLSYTFFSCAESQSAFATQNSQSHKKVTCTAPSKVTRHHATCTNKPKTSGRKAPAATQLTSTSTLSNVSSSPSTPLPVQTNTSTATAIDPALLLNIDSAVCKLPSQNTRGDVEIGFPRITNRVKSVGEIRAVMIFVDFSDAPATIAPKNLYSYFGSAPAILKEFSYGKADLHISADLQWHRMSRTSTSYGHDLRSSFPGLRSYMSEAIGLASTTVDFSKVDLVYVVSNPDAKSIAHSMAFVAQPGYEIDTGNAKIYNGAIFGADWPNAYAKTLVHETSHTFGLVDDYNGNYNASSFNDAFRFTGGFSIMGTIDGVSPEYFAWESWLMNWLDDSQVRCLAPGNQTLMLKALEMPGGLKLAVIPVSSTKAVLIETRRPLLADANLPTAGVLVYTVDTSIASANGPLKIIGGTLSLNLTDALLTKGDQLSIGNIKLSVIDSANESDTINISVS